MIWRAWSSSTPAAWPPWFSPCRTPGLPGGGLLLAAPHEQVMRPSSPHPSDRCLLSPSQRQTGSLQRRCGSGGSARSAGRTRPCGQERRAGGGEQRDVDSRPEWRERDHPPQPHGSAHVLAGRPAISSQGSGLSSVHGPAQASRIGIPVTSGSPFGHHRRLACLLHATACQPGRRLIRARREGSTEITVAPLITDAAAPSSGAGVAGPQTRHTGECPDPQ